MSTDDADVPDEARPDEIEFTLLWRPDGDSGLTGDLVARNVGDRTWRLTGKPGLVLTGTDGRDLDVRHVVTLEFRLPGHAVVAPGGTARARLSITEWDGTALGELVGVTWGGHRAEVRPTGPRQPTTPGAGRQTSSTWFVAD